MSSSSPTPPSVPLDELTEAAIQELLLVYASVATDARPRLDAALANLRSRIRAGYNTRGPNE